MTKLINNADDFGYSPAINYGIIDGYKKGVINSATLMAGMPGFEHAVSLAKENPGLKVGVHLTLTCGKPVLGGSSLTDSLGYFKKLSFYKDENTVVRDEEIYLEFKAQIDKVISAGIKPSHLDGHHHIQRYKNNPQIFKRLAKEYNLPVRNSFGDYSLREDGFKCPDVLLNPWTNLGEDMTDLDMVARLKTDIISFLEDSKKYDVVELMWHPAYLDYSIISNSSFAMPRIIENEVIGDTEFQEYLNNNFELITFDKI